MLRRTIQAAAVSLAVTTAASAQPLPDYGFDWATVGDPGNAPALQSNYPTFHRDVGRVDHTFRILRTPVTLSQWVGFANTLEAMATPQERQWLRGANLFVERDPVTNAFMVRPSHTDFGATSNFALAAMYCNWLHNGQSSERWAFDSGAYDMSALHQNIQGQWVFNADRSPGARFWIPSLDEHIKASYYDPDRYAPGEGGYWEYPHGSDEPPVYGAPWEPGAESSAGLDFPVGEWLFGMPLGLYPQTESPYGLLDVSGGVSAWTETSSSFATPGASMYLHGSRAGMGVIAPFADRISSGYLKGNRIEITSSGLRIASIPAPWTALPLALFCPWFISRRRVS